MRTYRWLRQLTVLVVLVGFVPVTVTGCFGRFQLTRNLYKFNQDVDPDKWIQWFTFLVFSVIPIYGVAGFIDVMFANSIEFWTGKNPIMASAGTTKVVHGENGELMTLTMLQSGAIDVRVEQAGGEPAHFTVVREANGMSAWDDQDRLLARVRDVGGQPALIEGAVLAR